MPRYSIRRLHLISEAMMAREIGVKESAKLNAFSRLYHEHPFVLKVIVREGELSRGLISAISLRGFACWVHDQTSCYVFADEPSLRDWTRVQIFSSSEEEIFVNELRGFLVRQARTYFEMSSDQYVLQFGGPTRLMGVLNVTPDSFFDGGKYAEKNSAVERGLALESEGADIIDIGGESTRPGADPVTEAEELERVIPVIEGLSSELQIPISIDTYKASVAEAAIQAGADIVNDVSAMRMDVHMMEVVAHYKVPVILMHMKGEPKNMQRNPVYKNLMDELYLFFEDRIEAAKNAGIPEDRIIIDPGIGFGKRLWDNYEILQRLTEFKGLGCPVLVGPSRKSFIGKVLNLPAEERLEGTAAAVAACVAGGSQIIRVHDVRQMLRVVQIADLIYGKVELQQQGNGG